MIPILMNIGWAASEGTPTHPGLEFTLLPNRLHFAMLDRAHYHVGGRLHYHVDERTHYSVSGRAHFGVQDDE